MGGILARYVLRRYTTIKSLCELCCLPKVVVIVGKYLLGGRGRYMNWCEDLLRDFYPAWLSISISGTKLYGESRIAFANPTFRTHG